MAIRLECTIEARSEYRLGEPITVTGKLSNAGEKGVWVLIWNTFLDGMRGDFAVLTLNGARIPYDGVLIRRGDPSKDKYLLIPPGGSVAGTVDLSSAYPINQPGDYQLTFVLPLHDAFEEGREDPPRGLDTHEPVEVSSLTTTIHIASGGSPLPTRGEQARKREEGINAGNLRTGLESQSTPTAPLIVNANGEETKEIHAAYNWAYQSVLASIEALQSSSISTNQTYQMWFGSYDSDRVQFVLNNYNAMKDWMTGTPVTFSLTDPAGACSSDTYAYIYYNTKTIYICKLFFTTFWSNDLQRAETCVHESAHAVNAWVLDKRYGELACWWLALNDPDKATRNADNYGFFSLYINPEPPPDNNGVWSKNSTIKGKTQVKPAAAASESAQYLLFSNQDDNTNKNWLWYRPWNIKKNDWGKPNRIKNASTNNYCITAAGPALAELNGTFYLLYIDGDSTSSTHNYLVYTYTSDSGDTWTQPAAVTQSAVTTMSPALAAGSDGNLYCAYVDSSGYLNFIKGTPGASGVSWGTPTATKYQSDIEPGLGVLNDTLFCMYTRGSAILQYITSTDGVNWTYGGQLPDSQTSAAPALVQWNSSENSDPVLMCLYRGVEPDRNLHYSLYDANWKYWSYEFRESHNATYAGPAIASYGSTLYEFHRGASSNQLYWAHTTDSSDDS